MSNLLYHGSAEIIEFPEVRKSLYTKDFSWGFYCTKDYEQAKRWTERYSDNGVINAYSYELYEDLKVLTFNTMTDEWLDFIAECRNGSVHDYDVVEGPMADDTIWNFANDYLNGIIEREVFWAYAKFKYPTHQMSFHTLKALDCLKFEGTV